MPSRHPSRHATQVDGLLAEVRELVALFQRAAALDNSDGAQAAGLQDLLDEASTLRNGPVADADVAVSEWLGIVKLVSRLVGAGLLVVALISILASALLVRRHPFVPLALLRC